MCILSVFVALGIQYAKRMGVIEHTVCCNFYTTFVWKIFPSKKNWARNDHKCISIFMYSTHYSYEILMEIEMLYISFKNSILGTN